MLLSFFVDKAMDFCYNGNMTQTEFAKKLGIARPYLNAILRKKRKGSVRLCEEISREFNIDFFELRPDLKELIKKHL